VNDEVDTTVKPGGMLVHPEFPHLSASLDMLEEFGPERRVVELKLWGRNDVLPDELPQETYIQVVMQLAIAAETVYKDKVGFSGAQAQIIPLSGRCLPLRARLSMLQSVTW